MKILLVQPYGKETGHYSPYTQNLAHGLRAVGPDIDVEIFSYTGFLEDWPKADGFTHYEAKPAARPSKLLDRLLSGHKERSSWATRCYETLQQAFAVASQYDAVHVIDSYLPTLWLAWRQAGRPINLTITVSMIEPFDSTWKTKLLKRRLWLLLWHALIRRGTGFVSHAPKVQSWFAEQFTHSTRPREKMIPWGIDIVKNMPSPAAARAAVDIPDDGRKVWLSFGVLNEAKGLPAFLRATESFASQVSYVIAGPPANSSHDNSLAEIKRAIQETAWKDNAILREGFIDDEDLPSYFAAADYCVLPYAAWFHGASGVLSVAAGHNTPVIATDHGSLGELAGRYRTGFVFKADDQNSLSDAVGKSLSLSPEETAELYVNIQNFQEAHSWKEIASQHIDVYSKEQR